MPDPQHPVVDREGMGAACVTGLMVSHDPVARTTRAYEHRWLCLNLRMRYRAWLPDPESLSVELDDASARASRNFGDALSAALGDVGATRMYTVKHLGARHVAKRGVIPYQVGPAAESLVVRAVTIHVPARLIDEVGDRVVDALERRIGAWRRESGNEELEIPICGPDGRVLRVAKRDGEISLTDR